jgi:hypothetical protein
VTQRLSRKVNISQSEADKSKRSKKAYRVASKEQHIERAVIPPEETETSSTEDDVSSNSGSDKSTPEPIPIQTNSVEVAALKNDTHQLSRKRHESHSDTGIPTRKNSYGRPNEQYRAETAKIQSEETEMLSNEEDDSSTTDSETAQLKHSSTKNVKQVKG